MRNIKLIFLIILTFLIGILATGCVDKLEPKNTAVNTTSPALTNLANVERQLLPELKSIKNKIDIAYTEWETGKISRDDLKKKIKKDIKPQYAALSKKFFEAEKANPLSEEDTKNPLFTEGLNHGKLLRQDVGVFLTTITVGQGTIVPSEDGKNYDVKFTPMDDAQLKQLYKDKVIDSYSKNLEKLNKALLMFPKE